MPRYPILEGDIAVVYSLATGRLRRWLTVDRTDHVHPTLAKGEGLLRRIPKRYRQTGHPQDFATAATGLVPSGDRYAVVDPKTRFVVGVVIADPACGDGYDGYRLIASDTAGPGWYYDGTTFHPPVDLTPPQPPVTH